jgi:hypothetical protein
VLGGIKSTVAGLMRVSHDVDDDEHVCAAGSGHGGGLWSVKHAAVAEAEYDDELVDKEGRGLLCGVMQVPCGVWCVMCGV